MLPFAALALLLFGLSRLLAQFGGIDDYWRAVRFDAPYLAMAFASLYFFMRPGYARFVIAAAPFVALYVAMDVHYILLHDVLKIDDVLLLPEIVAVSPWWTTVLVVAAVATWLAAFAFNIKRKPAQWLVPIALQILVALPVAASYTLPDRFLSLAKSGGFELIDWSDRYSAATTGRSLSLLLFAAARERALEKLEQLDIAADTDAGTPAPVALIHKKRNIHLVVLESLLLPEEFHALNFLSPPEPTGFEALRGKMHQSISPVFGGGTAQAEFEVLCGVPALELYSAAEFNMLTGASTRCLPTLLAEAGYDTIATQPYKPDFFNSEKAYESLGFGEINFPSIYAGVRDTYLHYETPNSYIFDGDLYAQNLAYIENKLKDGRPVLNYVLGIYGHLPHKMDEGRHPPKVAIEGLDANSQAYRAIQQFYYRAEALADYLKALRRIDPKGLILVVSDHLPPLDGGSATYDALGYGLGRDEGYKRNIWFYDGALAPGSRWPDHHYELADFLLDTLSEGDYCRQASCKHRAEWSPKRLRDAYTRIIAQGIRDRTSSSSEVAESARLDRRGMAAATGEPTPVPGA